MQPRWNGRGEATLFGLESLRFIEGAPGIGHASATQNSEPVPKKGMHESNFYVPQAWIRRHRSRTVNPQGNEWVRWGTPFDPDWY